MEIIDIDASFIEYHLKSEAGSIIWDYYRQFCVNGKDVIGLYYKLFTDLKEKNRENIEEYIETSKRIYNGIDRWPWEHHLVYGLFTKINRIAEAQKCIPCKLDVPVISGIVMCKNYPVGVIIPKKLLTYKSLIELKEEGVSLSQDEKELIFNMVELWVKSLMNHDVYPGLYLGNILVNPDDYSDVVLDGLDGPSICRVENKIYVDDLAKRGLDLREQMIADFNRLKDEFMEKDNPRAL